MDGVQVEDGIESVRESVIRRRRTWSALEKAQIVQEAQGPTAVLQEVAQRHGLHPSLLTRWRKQHQAGTRKAIRREARLVPVEIGPRLQRRTRQAQPNHLGESRKVGTIEVEFSAGRRMHIRGSVDVPLLRAVLQELSRS
jgi:transposase